jgi:hypothetical protein
LALVFDAYGIKLARSAPISPKFTKIATSGLKLLGWHAILAFDGFPESSADSLAY